MHNVKILADSISPTDVRLTTMEVTFPRCVLSEFNTHRTFSRNSASSRAIPVEKLIKQVLDNPYIPTHWGKNQKGMAADVEVSASEQDRARSRWLIARDDAVSHARSLLDVGIHKQITNRLLEPFMWQTVIVTATEWNNFFNLRCHPAAHPEIRKIATMMRDALSSANPRYLQQDEWHLPLIQNDEFVSDDNESIGFSCKIFSTDYAIKVSVGRCARVSYLTHDGKRDSRADVELHDRLLESGHLSPFEHVAKPALAAMGFHGNLRGWIPYRKMIHNEHDILEVR